MLLFRQPISFVMKSRKLKNAPLKEVIFELHWELKVDQDTGNYYDPEFDFALGSFAKKIADNFPHKVRTVPPFYPKELKINRPTFQFWTGENQYPVIQIGEGILSINNTDQTYHWENNFSPLIEDTVKNLFQSYIKEVTIKSASIRYINAIDFENEEVSKYFNKNFRFETKRNFDIGGSILDFNSNETHLIPEIGKLNLNFSAKSYQEKEKKQLIWQNSIYSYHDLRDSNDIFEWIEKAHQKLSDLFTDMLEKDFYESFK